MIPVHIAVHSPGGGQIDGGVRRINIEVLDLPAVTPQAVMVSLYEALLATNESTFDTSYHVTGRIDLEGYRPSPLDLWISAGDQMPSPMQAASQVAERFFRLYSNGARQGAVRGIDLDVEAIPRRIQAELETARLVSNDIVHAGDKIGRESL